MTPPKVMVGLDEVGRGPWAGPINACAVVIPNGVHIPPDTQDSKALDEPARERIAKELKESVAFGLGEVSAQEIDQWGLGWANRHVFLRALSALRSAHPDLRITEAVIDGNPIKHPDFLLPVPFSCHTKGESKFPEIACASIIAKTHRDQKLREIGETHPQYGFAAHKGYGTAQHRKALLQHGTLPGIHRMSFAPLKNLPLAAEKKPPGTKKFLLAEGVTQQILVVDDDPIFHRLLKHVLNGLNVDILCADDGEEGLDYLKTTSCDLVILDFCMPKFSGIETLKRIRKQEGYQLPVIMLTGSDQTQIRKAAEKFKVMAFLTKPFSPSHLTKLIRGLLQAKN